MPVQQLRQLEGYKRFTDGSNNTWQMGNPNQGKSEKGVNCYTTAEYNNWPCN